MPRLDNNSTQFNLGMGFSFSGIGVDKLQASSYTLVNIAVDESGSVDSFSAELDNMIATVIAAIKLSPQSDNILLRVTGFGSQYGGVDEFHGYMTIMDIDTANYRKVNPQGSTPLNDAVYSSLASTAAYAKTLADNEFLSNGIVFVITDGGENASTSTMPMIKAEQSRLKTSESLESLVSILIGINASSYSNVLQNYVSEAGMTHYIDAGNATAGNLAKLAAFVSKSIASQSQAIGTGGPSQSINATI